MCKRHLFVPSAIVSLSPGLEWLDHNLFRHGRRAKSCLGLYANFLSAVTAPDWMALIDDIESSTSLEMYRKLNESKNAIGSLLALWISVATVNPSIGARQNGDTGLERHGRLIEDAAKWTVSLGLSMDTMSQLLKDKTLGERAVMVLNMSSDGSQFLALLDLFVELFESPWSHVALWQIRQILSSGISLCTTDVDDKRADSGLVALTRAWMGGLAGEPDASQRKSSFQTFQDFVKLLSKTHQRLVILTVVTAPLPNIVTAGVLLLKNHIIGMEGHDTEDEDMLGPFVRMLFMEHLFCPSSEMYTVVETDMATNSTPLGNIFTDKALLQSRLCILMQALNLYKFLLLLCQQGEAQLRRRVRCCQTDFF